MRGSHVVLFVLADETAAEEMGSWVTEDGGLTVRCPGPHPPTYECRGWADQHCLLVDACDVAVLDLRLDSDVAMEGPPAWELAALYRRLGKPVIALADPGDAVEIIADPGVVVLRRRPDRTTLLSAIRGSIGRSREGTLALSSATRAGSDTPAGAPVADVADIWL